MTLLEALRDVLARIVAARAEIEAGDIWCANEILRDLEDDVVVVVER